MLRLLCIAASIHLFSVQPHAQTVAGFEDFDLEAESFDNGSDGSGGFSSGNVFLPNTFTDFGTFTAWTGWALSNVTDTLTPGFTNQYSAITGRGAEGSATYAVSYTPDSSVMELIGQARGGIVEGLYVTNSTYAYISMRDGDNIARKFGGATGEDPDFFLLTIRGFLGDALTADSVTFYLADYRFEDPDEDYLIDDWTFVDLSGLGPVDSLRFSLTSSDVGGFGMNTPAYFCVDQIVTRDGLVGTRPATLGPPLRIFPNPAFGTVRLTWGEQRESILTLTDVQGRETRRMVIRPGHNEVDLWGLPPGTYVASVLYRGVRRSRLLVIR